MFGPYNSRSDWMHANGLFSDSDDRSSSDERAERAEEEKQILAVLSKYPQILSGLAEIEDEKFTKTATELRMIAAKCSGTPLVSLMLLAKDKYWEIRYYVSIRTDITPEILEILSNDEDWGIRLEVGEHAKTSPEVLAKLTTDPEYDVRKAAVFNLNTPDKAISSFIKKLKWYEVRNLASVATSPKFLANVIKHSKHPQVISAIIDNYHTPMSAILEIVRNDIEGKYHESILKRLSLSDEVMRELSKSEKFSCRKKVAEDSRTPLDVLETLAKDEVPSVKKKAKDRIYAIDLKKKIKLASSSDTSPEALEEFAKINSCDLHEAVAKNSNTLPDTLDELADKYLIYTGEYPYVATAIAMNPNTSSTTLGKLANHYYYHVLICVAKNPNTTPDDLTKLSKYYGDSSYAHISWQVRLEVAKNPHTPYPALVELSKDSNSAVISAALIRTIIK